MSSNITVNGIPLEIHVDKEIRKEIAEIRESETKLKRYKSPVRGGGNISGARSGKAVSRYLGDAKATDVLMLDLLWPMWGEDGKAASGFEASGMSCWGGVEYDKLSETFKCHECGQWYAGLGQHIQGSHSDKYRAFRDYKIEHGLSVRRGVTTPYLKREMLKKAKRHSLGSLGYKLGKSHNGRSISRSIRAERSLRRNLIEADKLSPEHANVRLICRAQTETAVKTLSSSLGRTPTIDEMDNYKNSEGRHPLEHTRLVRLYGSARNFMLIVGLTPRKHGRPKSNVA